MFDVIFILENHVLRATSISGNGRGRLSDLDSHSTNLQALYLWHTSSVGIILLEKENIIKFSLLIKIM